MRPRARPPCRTRNNNALALAARTVKSRGARAALLCIWHGARVIHLILIWRLGAHTRSLPACLPATRSKCDKALILFRSAVRAAPEAAAS